MSSVVKGRKKNKPRPYLCLDLLTIFRKAPQPALGEKLVFDGVSNEDVYNITAPFKLRGVTYLVGRVERGTACWLTDPYEVRSVFFVERGENVWTPAPRAPMFILEDPFVARIGEELVFGGVEIFSEKPGSKKSLRTVFYRGRDILKLEKFALGPKGMKDIRLVELDDGRIGIFTRPQGGRWGRGKIGFIAINSLEELPETDLMAAKILEGQFAQNEWGGVNEVRRLDDGKLGILGHIARKARKDGRRVKRYYAMAFTFDPNTFKSSNLRIVATRKNFPPGPAKRSPELDDVVFPGGFIDNRNGTFTLYTGLSDAEAGRITISDPFSN